MLYNFCYQYSQAGFNLFILTLSIYYYGRKAMIILLPLCFCFLFSISANGFTHRNNDSLPFYEMQATIYPNIESIDIQLTLHAPVHLLEDSSLSFLFSSNAVVNSLSGAHLNTYDVKEAGPGIFLYQLNFNSTLDETVSVKMNYTLVIPNDHQVNRISKNWIELNIDSFWHPFLTSYTRFHYSLIVELDKDYQLLSGDRINLENTQTRIIHSAFPRIDISFSASNKFYSKEGKYTKVFSTQEYTDLDSLLKLSDQALNFLKNYIDIPEDFKKKRIVIESSRQEVGYSRENYIMLSKLDQMNPLAISAFLSHEFSHYWFYNGNPQGPEHWLNESFSEFISMVYIRDAYGVETYQENLKSKVERSKQDPNTLASYQERPSHIALYYTGPVVLHHYEDYLGKEEFRLLIQQMTDKKISSNEDLLTLINDLFGPKAKDKLVELRNTLFD